MPVSVKVTVKAARRERHMSSGWLRKTAQHVESAADAARAMEKAKLEAVGVLNSRKEQIPREAGGLQAMLSRYLNGTIGQYEKTKDVKAELSDMLRRMEFVVNKVLGRKQDEAKGEVEIKAKLADTFNGGEQVRKHRR